jgi:hypothetical protein
MANFDASAYLGDGAQKNDLTVWEMHGSSDNARSEKEELLHLKEADNKGVDLLSTASRDTAALRALLPEHLRETPLPEDTIVTVVSPTALHNISVAHAAASASSQMRSSSAIPQTLSAARNSLMSNNNKHEQTNTNTHAGANVQDVVAGPDPPADPVGPFYTDHCMCPRSTMNCRQSFMGTYQGCLQFCKEYDGQPGGYLAFIPHGQYTVTYSDKLRVCSCCGSIDPCTYRK